MSYDELLETLRLKYKNEDDVGKRRAIAALGKAIRSRMAMEPEKTVEDLTDEEAQKLLT